ncbi:MAG: biotin--[acetyl-CoA-carboxylase] ligase [Tissierellia bacterium]|nr:biotin--[acetyl-CoA-carboxylase] ligase [Tissierellia bacterium]
MRKKTEDLVEKVLMDHRGTYFSGQELADRLNVSRTAIWKAVEKLREGGLDIEAMTKKGYRLAPSQDALDEVELKTHLLDQFPREKLRIFESIDSTNSALARDDDESPLPHFTTYVAEEQTAGRGRTGREFQSPAYSGLYFSFLLKDAAILNPEKLSPQLITVRAAVALYLAIKRETGIETQIKWVNDLFYDGRKITGILTEGKIQQGRIQRIIVGVGLNVYTAKEQFKAEFQEIAASLNPKNTNRSLLLAAILNELYLTFHQRSDEEILKIYREQNLVLGKTVEFTKNDILYQGLARDINGEGNLLVTVGDEEMVLTGGEVSLKGDWYERRREEL